jgi:hypothetical protein
MWLNEGAMLPISSMSRRCSSKILRTFYTLVKRNPLNMVQVTLRFVKHGPFFIFRLLYLCNQVDASRRPKGTVILSSGEGTGNKYWPANTLSPRTHGILQQERYKSLRLSDFLYKVYCICLFLCEIDSKVTCITEQSIRFSYVSFNTNV